MTHDYKTQSFESQSDFNGVFRNRLTTQSKPVLRYKNDNGLFAGHTHLIIFPLNYWYNYIYTPAIAPKRIDKLKHRPNAKLMQLATRDS